LRIIANDEVEPICGTEKGADVANQTRVTSIDRSGGRERRGLMRQVNEAPVGRPVVVCAPADERDTTSPDEDDSGELSEILFEQLGYLIKYADREREGERLDRVMAILMETFN
jgi:hypothetical protein